MTLIAIINLNVIIQPSFDRVTCLTLDVTEQWINSLVV